MNENNNSIRTIGILAYELKGEYSARIIRGAVQEAVRLGIRTVIFPGKDIRRNTKDIPEMRFDYQYTTMYDLAAASDLDAVLIASGSILNSIDKEDRKKFLAQFDGIPVVLMGGEEDGYASINFDNRASVKKGLSCMIEKYGCRKIGMISANSLSRDIVNREKAYREVMAQHSLSVDENMITRGWLSEDNGDAASKLLEQCPDLDGVFCVNDNLALKLYEVMEEEGLRPGVDLSIMGFDDDRAALYAVPDLSSVRADGFTLGARAVRMAQAMKEGGKPEQVSLPTEFVERDSFCRKEGAVISASEIFEKQQGGEVLLNPADYYADIFSREPWCVTRHQSESLKEVFSEILEILEKMFVRHEESEDDRRKLEALQSVLLEPSGLHTLNPRAMILVFNRIFNELLNYQTNDHQRYLLRSVSTRAFMTLTSADNRVESAQRRRREEIRNITSVFLTEMMEFESGDDRSYAVMLDKMTAIGVMYAVCLILPEPVTHEFGESFRLPEKLLLKAILKEGRIVEPEQKEVRCDSLFCLARSIFPADVSKVIVPLYYGRTIYGFLISEDVDYMYGSGRIVVDQVSSAVRVIDLLRKNEEAERRLLKSLEYVRSTNQQLDEMSRKDALCGILNRRGFFTEAQAALEEIQKEKRAAAVFFIDMNDLKGMNDNWGHDAGDLSLKTIGSFLAQLGNDLSGIPARIGGDEFCFFLPAENDEELEEKIARFRRDLDQKFAAFNRTNRLPRTLAAASGCQRLDDSRTWSLEDLMNSADAYMYEDKQRSKHSH